MLRHHPSYLAIQQAYPHVAAKILEAWGTPAFLQYMGETLYNNRPDPRQGFPQAVLLALQSLTEAHHRLHPHLAPQDGFWSHVESPRA